jgi:hypothetical protein
MVAGLEAGRVVVANTEPESASIVLHDERRRRHDRQATGRAGPPALCFAGKNGA